MQSANCDDFNEFSLKQIIILKHAWLQIQCQKLFIKGPQKLLKLKLKVNFKMLVERDRNGLLSNPGGFKKSATENSELNKKAVKNVGRYSGSFSPPGDGDVRAIYDMTTVKEMEINDIQVKNSTPTRGEGKNKPLDNEILSGLRGCVINEKREQRTIRGRDSLFTPQLNRREPVQRFESPMLGGKRYPLGHFQNTQSFQNNFSSPKSERGFVIRREKSNFSSPAR